MASGRALKEGSFWGVYVVWEKDPTCWDVVFMMRLIPRQNQSDSFGDLNWAETQNFTDQTHVEPEKWLLVDYPQRGYVALSINRGPLVETPT